MKTLLRIKDPDRKHPAEGTPKKPGPFLRPPLKFFDRYILQEIFPPFLIGLLLYTFVLLMNQILMLAEMFIAKGVSFWLAARILLYLVPSLLAFAVPMAVLMGILAGLSRLSTDSEIVAFKTLGISYKRLARPVFLFAFCGWLVTSYLALWLAPRANYKWVQTLTNSVLARVQLKIIPREFNDTIPNMVIFMQDISREKGWQNIFVHLTDDVKEPKAILARRGRINLHPATKRATLELFDGTVHSYKLARPDAYSVTAFESLEQDINVESLFSGLTSDKRVREKDVFELWKGIQSLREEKAAFDEARAAGSPPAAHSSPAGARPQGEWRKAREYRSHWVELNKKFALPFVCFIFVLIGLPLGATTRKGGRTSGFTISIGIILLYYILITAGEKMAMDGEISPFVGMWGPNILMLIAGFYLFIKSLRETAVFSSLLGLFKKRRRLPAERKIRKPLKLPRVRLRFPNILDRYVIRKYLALIALVFMALVSVSVIVTFFERIDNVYEHDKPLGLFLHYIWFRIPEFVYYILPVSTLTAALLTFGLLAKFNEVTAMKSCGISLYRLILPVLVMALGASVGSFYLQERLLPEANRRAEEIWNKINDIPPRSYSYLNRHWVLGRNKERIYHYDYFDPVPSAFSRISIFDIDTESWTLKSRYFAEKAYLGEAGIALQEGWRRDFAGERPVVFETKKSIVVPSEDKKTYFLKEWKEPSQMTLAELREYTAEIDEMGFESTNFKVDMNYKISFPFVCLIMTLLGVPFAFSMGKKGTLVGIGLSIVIAMVYWGTIGVFKSLGYVGFLSPFLAAWAPNLIFGLVGIYLLFRLRT
ncbi:MAG: LptF/LptG family permease [Acidobacteriota bacterium]|nr:LptF/LptG family permease [Acidobacteriota bacterium]